MESTKEAESALASDRLTLLSAKQVEKYE